MLDRISGGAVDLRRGGDLAHELDCEIVREVISAVTIPRKNRLDTGALGNSLYDLALARFRAPTTSSDEKDRIAMTQAGDRYGALRSGPRILLVLPDLPLIEGGAPGRFFVALLRGLKANDVDVRAIAAGRFFTPAGEVPPDLPVEIVDFKQPSRWRSRAERLVRPLGELSWGGFASRIDEASRHVDLIHVETTRAAWTDGTAKVPSAIHFHYLAGLDRSYGSPWTKQFWQVAEETRGERAMVRRHRYLIASSPVVAASLRERAPRAEVVVAPLCLAPEHYPAASVGSHATAGLIGTASWPSTAAAIDRLTSRIWPAVRKELPDAELVIAGRGTNFLQPSAGIGVLGEVRDAAEFLQGLGLLLYPATRGSGMKVKVLEALATGVPVVTTSAGAEGIVPNDGVIVAKDDTAIVRATVGLLRDGAERMQRGSAARKTFEAHYTPEIATRPLVKLYAAMGGDG
jgi:glycosyltransferase involved in cell wall biosynthesis